MPQQPARILIVDDELPVRVTLAAILQRQGYTVTTAEDGETALDLIARAPFDLLLLDLKMPGLSGLDLARRATELHEDVAITILTGHGLFETGREAGQQGPFDSLMKTTSPDEVVAHVAAALARRHES